MGLTHCYKTAVFKHLYAFTTISNGRTLYTKSTKTTIPRRLSPWRGNNIVMCYSTRSIRNHNVHGGPKRDCFWEQLTLQRLRIERRVIFQNFQNFVYNEMRTMHVSAFKYSLPKLPKEASLRKTESVKSKMADSRLPSSTCDVYSRNYMLRETLLHKLIMQVSVQTWIKIQGGPKHRTVFEIR